MLLLQQTADFQAASLFIQRQAAEDAERRKAYKRNWKYYSGDQSLPLKVRQGQANDNVIVNLVRLVVDKGASFLFGKEVEFQLEEGTTTPAEDYLKEVWAYNKKQTFLTKASTSGGVFGHVFIKLDPAGEDLPRLTNILPENMHVSWLPDDPETAWLYTITWNAQGRDGKMIVFRQIIEQVESGAWEIRNERALPGGNWEPDPDRPDPEWPYSWPPIHHCQNIPVPNCFYGASDIEDLSEQDAVNFSASNINRILRNHAHPKTLGKGFQGGDLTMSSDEITLLPGTDSDVWNLEMQSDLGSSIVFMDRMKQLFLEQARTPQLDPTQINIGALSGFAMQILQGPLIEKTETKRNTYGDMLVEINQHMLEVGGHGEDNVTTLHWPNPLPVDENAEQLRDGFELDKKLVSRETVQKRRGIDPEEEKERIDDDSDADGNVGAAVIRDFMTNRNGPGTEEAPSA